MIASYRVLELNRRLFLAISDRDREMTAVLRGANFVKNAATTFFLFLPGINFAGVEGNASKKVLGLEVEGRKRKV